VFDFDLPELRQILTDKASQVFEALDPGYERHVTMEPLFNVVHGQANLRAIRVRIEDVQTASKSPAMFFSATSDDRATSPAAAEGASIPHISPNGSSKH